MQMRFERRRARLSLAGVLVVASGAGCAEIAGLQYIGEKETGGGAFSGPGYTCQWAMSFGDADTRLGGIAADRDGTLWLAGGFKGNIEVAGGEELRAGGDSEDVFVAHLARDGNHLWSKRFGNAQNDSRTHVHRATSIALGGAGVYLAGDFTGSLSFGGDCGLPGEPGAEETFLARIDKNDPGGVATCVTRGSGDVDHAAGVAVDDNRVLVLTSLQGGESLGLSSYDGQTLGSPCDAVFPGLTGARFEPFGLRVSAGEAFVFSEFNGRVRLGFPGSQELLPPGGGPAQGTDAFVASFPSAWICGASGDEGAQLRVQHYSPLPGDQHVASVSPHGAGVYVAGSFEGEIDLGGEPGGMPISSDGGKDGFLVSLDEGGGARWAQHVEGGAVRWAQAVDSGAADQVDEVVVAGPFRDRLELGGDVPPLRGEAGGEDFFLARFRGEDGALEWLGGVSGPGEQELQALAVSGTDVFLAGTSSATFKLLNCEVEREEGQLFIAKLSISSRPSR
ncbi:hypothetical protein SOCE26_059930 [Sorangium cellulosum]|uniref:Secreted protein n=1 Tax=Sorangium cellulosum TaxID=56 RepID=A0A2L0EZ71_SORCE|nr:hypothetical protein [Sorangium cellulosum]AUX44529.1 hypothetical protein SOCE26_059930 [Sorangium cellulosum]